MMELQTFLQPTPAIDYNHPVVKRYVDRVTAAVSAPRERAVALYYAVRDDFRYDPYRLDLTVQGMRASATVNNGYGWCVPKAVLLVACCRGCGIPARLAFGDVRNHLSTRRLRERMQTDIFYWHGYAEIYLGKSWVKATPAFNRELCERLNIATLEFDGWSDSVFHPFDQQGKKYMEYIRYRGSYADLPLAEILETFKLHYSQLLSVDTGRFDQDVDEEVSG